MVTEEESTRRKKGQRKEECSIVGCPNTGRKFGSIGTLDICYCPRHRKIGEKIMNYLFDSKRRYLRSDLLGQAKHSLLFENKPELCESCNKKIIDLLQEGIIKIDADEEFLYYENDEQDTEMD